MDSAPKSTSIAEFWLAAMTNPELFLLIPVCQCTSAHSKMQRYALLSMQAIYYYYEINLMFLPQQNLLLCNIINIIS